MYAVALTVLLGLLGALQLALALGAPLGRFVWGGQHRVLPPRLRIGSLVGIGIYTVIALIALDRAGRIDLFPNGFTGVAMWVIVGYLTLSIALNAASRSKAERMTMVPMTVALAGLSLLVALEV